MRKAIVSLSLSLLIIVSSSLIYAQPKNESPLMVSFTVPDLGIVHNDLYQYTGDHWEQVTSGGYKAGFSLSPDGTQIAYQIAPTFLQELIAEHGASHLSTAARDIAMLDLATGDQRVIAGQPANVEIDEDNQNFSNGITRSRPVWSPDGTALAWTEQDYPEQDGVARLVMADIVTGEIHVVDDALPQMNMSSDGLPGFLSWGTPGIAVFTNDPDDFEETIRLYDPVAGTMQIIRDSSEDSWLPTSGLLWINENEHHVLVLEQDGFNWLRVDPESGTTAGLSSQLDFVSATNPATSLRLSWDIYALPGATEWQMLTPEGTMLQSWGDEFELAQIVMSPSGKAIAYLQDNEVHLWQDGVDSLLPLPESLTPTGLIWGHMNVQFGAEYDSVG